MFTLMFSFSDAPKALQLHSGRPGSQAHAQEGEGHGIAGKKRTGPEGRTGEHGGYTPG